jgi:hypothetical protein
MQVDCNVAHYILSVHAYEYHTYTCNDIDVVKYSTYLHPYSVCILKTDSVKVNIPTCISIYSIIHIAFLLHTLSFYFIIYIHNNKIKYEKKIKKNKNQKTLICTLNSKTVH